MATINCVLVLLVTLMATTVYCGWQNVKLKKQLLDIKTRNPTEADLELATLDQIFAEIRKRPFRYVLISPKFHIDEEAQSIRLEGVQVESSGMPQHVAKDVVQATSEIMERGVA